MRAKRIRNGLIGIAGMSILGLDLGAALAADRVTWNISLWGARRPFTEGVELLSSEAAKRTDGNFTIKLHYGEAISPVKENLDSVKIGVIEAAAICVSYHPGKTPAMTGLDLPFLPLPTFDIQKEVHEAYYRHPAVVKEMAAWNAEAIFSNLLQQYEFLGAGKPPRSLDDWKGMRVRATGGLGDAMRLLGATPTSMAAPEVYTALERGLIDAAAFPFSTAHAAFRLHEVSTWFTGNLNPGVINCPLVVNRDALAALPAEYRQMIYDLKPAMYEAMKQAYIEGDAKWIPLFREKMEEIRYDPAAIAELKKRGAEPIWKAWVEQVEAKKVPGQELLDLILEEAKKAGA